MLKIFNLRWARRVLGWGTVVLVISNGWDRGEPELLRQEIVRLQRNCHRLIWLNPMLGSPSYQPPTQGMQAVLPFVGDLLPVNNLAGLGNLARHLSTLSPQRPARRQQVTLALSMPTTEDMEAPMAVQRSGHPDANPTFRHPLWRGPSSHSRTSDTPEPPRFTLTSYKRRPGQRLGPERAFRRAVGEVPGAYELRLRIEHMTFHRRDQIEQAGYAPRRVRTGHPGLLVHPSSPPKYGRVAQRAASWVMAIHVAGETCCHCKSRLSALLTGPEGEDLRSRWLI